MKAIRALLTPEQQQQLDQLNHRQKRELVAVAEERGARWVARHFRDLHLEVIRYIR